MLQPNVGAGKRLRWVNVPKYKSINGSSRERSELHSVASHGLLESHADAFNMLASPSLPATGWLRFCFIRETLGSRQPLLVVAHGLIIGALRV